MHGSLRNVTSFRRFDCLGESLGRLVNSQLVEHYLPFRDHVTYLVISSG